MRCWPVDMVFIMVSRERKVGLRIFCGSTDWAIELKVGMKAKNRITASMKVVRV